MISSDTPTPIRIEMPEKPSRPTLLPPLPSNWNSSADGMRAMAARNSEPGRVIRLRILARCRSVWGPGRTPVMKPPDLRSSSARRAGSKAMAL